MSGHTTKNPESTPPSSRSDSPTNVNNRTDLSTYELEGEGRPPFVLSFPEVKLLGIAGVRFHVTRPLEKHDTNLSFQVGFFLDG